MPGADGPATARPDQSTRRHWRRELFESLLVAGAVATGALSTGWPENALQWGLLATAAILGGLAPRAPLRARLRAGIQPLLRRLRPAGLRRPLVIATVAIVAAGLGRVLVMVGPDATAWASARLFGCPNPTEMRVVATPEGLATARELAEQFSRQAAEENHGCVAANLYVYAVPPAAAREALTRGWSATDLRTVGPRPDLWLPGSTGYAVEATPGGLLPGVRTTSVASTPVVLAVPAEGLSAELATGRTTLGWAEALSVVDRLRLRLVRPDPALSVVGELATVAIYASGGGDPERLADPGSAVELANAAQAPEIERRIARGLDERRYPLGNDVDLLCRHRQSGAAPVALIVAEQQLVRFNAGLPLGGQCPEASAAPLPADRLLGVYPSDTLSLDYPLVSLDWSQRSPQQQQWIVRFQDWLSTRPGRQALIAAGLRPPATPVGHPLTETLGALPGVSYSRVTPAAGVVSRARQLHTAAQRPGRVLIALDASKSMERAAGGSTSRFAVAAAAVSLSLSRMSGRDEFGLWVFQGRGRPPARLVPIGSGGGSREALADRALRAITPSGDTPLYRAIVDGVVALSPADPGRANALVVLTDGRDHGSGVTGPDMVAAVRSLGIRVFVVAIGEATCGTQAIRDVTRNTGGGCLEAAPDSLDATLTELFRLLWGGT